MSIFVLAIVLTVVALCASTVDCEANAVVIALTVAMGFYCFLRATGALGPRPS